MIRGRIVMALALALCAAAAAWVWRARQDAARQEISDPNVKIQRQNAQLRRALFDELQPVRLSNCRLERFGEVHDGGYLLCGNLLDAVQSGYSYGISGYDGWGCAVAKRTGITVHEYDCFDLHVPACDGGATVFHGECVAGIASTDKDGRVFDTPQNQFAKNGDAAKRIVMKIDVEGAEWETFLRTPADVLQRIDQLAVEFHGAKEQRALDVVRKLKQHFYIANLHFNNYSCVDGLAPFPAWGYEALFVSKRIGVVDPRATGMDPAAPNAPNNPDVPDCQS